MICVIEGAHALLIAALYDSEIPSM